MAVRLIFLVAKAKMDKLHKKTVKRNYKVRKKALDPHPDYSAAFSVNEVRMAIDNMKLGKAAGLDGVDPEFINIAVLKPKCGYVLQ